MDSLTARVRVEAGPEAGKSFALAPGETKVLGQGPGADFVLADPFIAAQHAALSLAPGSFVVVNLDPLGIGTRLNDDDLPLREPRAVRHGDRVWLGQLPLVVEVEGALAPPALPRPQASTARRVRRVVEGRYEIEGELGAGALGRVYAARRLSDGLPVAIKILRGVVAEGSNDHKRFLREGALAARVESPHVVRVLEAVTEADQAHLVMERVEGPTLRDLVAAGPLPLADVLRYGAELAEGLAAAAEQGVVHRDVKPGNVFVTASGALKLGDFGAAKSVTETRTALTLTGQGLGSMAYMAPEQLTDAKYVDDKADAYALGATLYHLLAGKPPFQPRTATDLIAVLEQPAPPLDRIRSDLPRALVRLVHDLLHKEPAKRPGARKVVKRLAKLAAI